MIEQLNHIGIAVQNLDQHIPFYRDILKLNFEGIEEIQDQKVRMAMFNVGGVRIELLEPTTSDSPIALFIEKKGEGLHHIAYQSNNIDAELAALTASQVQLIDQTPRAGAHQTRIAFLHPRSSGRVLTEICQAKGEVHE
jgi:methylmalonyl-CoA/ethylmalonyl-CoA epimerase